MKITKHDLKTAEANYIKFWQWLEKKYPPPEVFMRVIAAQYDECFIIQHVWRYGSVSETTNVTKIPLYPRFDPDFEPETFYNGQPAN